MNIWRKIWPNRHLLREGYAERVIFYYPGEDGTYLDGAFVKVFKNGMVDVFHSRENVSSHIQNIEIIWKKSAPKNIPNGGKPFILYQFEKTP